MTITTDQLRVLRHALGLNPDGTGREYRKTFVAGPGSDDYGACRACADAGLMVEIEPLFGSGPCVQSVRTAISLFSEQ